MSSSSSLSSNPWAAWLEPLTPLDLEGSPWVDEPSRPTTSISSSMLQQQEESRQQQQRARRSTLIRRRVQFIDTVEYVADRTWDQEEESSSSEEQDRSGSPSESLRRGEEDEEDPIPTTPQPSSAYSYFYNPSSSHPLPRLQPSFLFTPRTEPAPVAPALVNSPPQPSPPSPNSNSPVTNLTGGSNAGRTGDVTTGEGTRRVTEESTAPRASSSTTASLRRSDASASSSSPSSLVLEERSETSWRRTVERVVVSEEMEEETGQTRERLVERPTAEVGRRIASGTDINAPRRVGLEPPRQTETRPSLPQPVRRLHNDPSPSVPAQPPASSSTSPPFSTSPDPQTQTPPPSQRRNPHGRTTAEINNPSSSSSRPQPFPYRTDEELDAISDRHLAYARLASMEEIMWLGGGVEVGASGRGRGRGRGTPRSVVEGLRRTTFEELLEESRVTGRELERSCGICLEEYGLRDETITSPCDHFWHRRCFEGWLRTSQNCPLCRRNVVELARTNGPPPYSIAAPTSRSSTRGCSIQ